MILTDACVPCGMPGRQPVIASPPSSRRKKMVEAHRLHIAIWRGVRTMCGIAGFVSFNGSVDRGVLTAMTQP